MQAIVYIIDDNNEIVHEFKSDWDFAIRNYFGKKDFRGRFYVGVEGKPVPYKKKPKRLFKFNSRRESEKVQDH